jgi:hypothetical protein
MIMNTEFATLDASSDEIKPLAGWACVAVGVGFIVTLTMLIIAVRLLAI